MFAVDGLEVKVWGKRDDAIKVNMGMVGGDESPKQAEMEDGIDDESDNCESEEDEGGSSEERTESEADDESDSESESVLASSSGSDLGSGLGSSGDSIIDRIPPPSRSPSPQPSLDQTQLPDPTAPEYAPEVISQPPAKYQDQTQTYASEQEIFRTAERLLSRTLANACAEDDGKGMGKGTGMAAEIGMSSV
jgi:hypothetical protein